MIARASSRRFLLAPISPLARFLRLTAAACLFLMMLLSVIDVIGRYFMRPLFGATEMIQLLLAITIFAAIGLTSLARGHVTVDILEPIIDRFAARPRRRLVQFAEEWIAAANERGIDAAAALEFYRSTARSLAEY